MLYWNHENQDYVKIACLLVFEVWIKVQDQSRDAFLALWGSNHVPLYPEDARAQRVKTSSGKVFGAKEALSQVQKSLCF